MESKTGRHTAINCRYVIVVLVSTLLIPVAGFVIEAMTENLPYSFSLFGKWFIFSAVGLRLFIAGVKQISDPAFTAREIFHIKSDEVFPVVRELGFANLCFGLIGIASLFFPSWRIVSAFGSGLYYGLAALLHIIKKPAGFNELFALLTDVVIFTLLLIYFVVSC